MHHAGMFTFQHWMLVIVTLALIAIAVKFTKVNEINIEKADDFDSGIDFNSEEMDINIDRIDELKETSEEELEEKLLEESESKEETTQEGNE